jgi:Bacterial protein of unknown function (DUF937)
VTCRRAISVAGLRPCPVGSGTHDTRIQGDASSLQARNIRHEERKQTAGLLDLISSWMTPEVVQKLAGQAGISAGDATCAIDAIILAQLRDVVAMSSNEAGANQLLSVLKEHEGTESFAHILLGGDAIQRQATVGETLQSAVYGNDLGRRLSSMASSLGIPQGAASSTGLGGTSPLPFFEGIELMAVGLLSLRYHLDRVRSICSRLGPVTTD